MMHEPIRNALRMAQYLTSTSSSTSGLDQLGFVFHHSLYSAEVLCLSVVREYQVVDSISAILSIAPAVQSTAGTRALCTLQVLGTVKFSAVCTTLSYAEIATLSSNWHFEKMSILKSNDI